MKTETRLLRYWHLASPEQRARGLEWYSKAERIAADMAALCGITQAQAAGIIAAVSPTTPWEQNLIIAKRIVRYGRGWGTYRRNVEKALAIRAGADPTAVLGGPKTCAFAANMAGDRERVTIDRHMFTACGHDKRQCTHKEYATMAAATTKAAQRVGVCPRDFQAVVWLVVREARKPRAHPGQTELYLGWKP